MRIRNCSLAALLSVALSATATSWAQPSALLLRPADVVHLGSFKLPEVSPNGFSYGGAAPAYHAANDSLYIVGHAHHLQTAEVSIPGLGATAEILQPLTDSLSGARGAIGGDEHRIGGNLVYNGRLYVTAFIYYDASGSQTASHYSRSLALRDGGAVGPARAGSLGAGFYSGYMGLVPDEWQAALGGPALTGNCCLSIISRTSFGPALFSFDPGRIGNARPLLYYPMEHPTLGRYGEPGAHPVFNGSTRITGVVFPTGTASVLFFGMTGIGPYCYGEAAECKDPVGIYKGEHAYPYRGYVWAYDARDLAAVRAGKKRPWSVVPYATWELPELGDLSPDFGLGGAAYDPAGGRVFVSAKFGDGDRPLIHVFGIGSGDPSRAAE